MKRVAPTAHPRIFAVAAVAAYVLLNSAGGPASLRRFAHEVRPAFADATLQPA